MIICIKNKFNSEKQTISILELLSTYRSILMGIAILWVMFYHAPLIISNPILQLIKNRGFIGVDIFLLVSGYGLYYASLKREPIQIFYKKRFWRIFPAFFIVVTVNYVLSPHITFANYLIELTTLGIWFQYPFYAWYISILVLLYILFPFYLDFFRKKPRLMTYLTILICFIICSIYMCLRPQLSMYLINRIPIFVTGIFFAYLAKNNEKTTTWEKGAINSIAFILAGIILKYILDKYYYESIDIYNPLTCYFMTIGICFGICILFKKTERFQITKKLTASFSFLGTISLELYLVHGDGYYNIAEKLGSYESRNWISFILTIACIIIAYLLSKLCILIKSKYLKKHNNYDK